MKNRAIVIALLMVFIVTVPCISIESDLDAGSYEEYRPAYDSLSPAQKTLYTNLENAVDHFRTSVKVSGLSLDETRDVYYALYSDFPEFYWFEESYSIFYNPNTGLPSEIKTQGPLDSDKLLKGIEEIGDNIREKFNITGDTTAEKLQSIQQNLAFNIVYDKTTENCGSMYGAIVEGKAKCDGYSQAFQFICKALDIPCVTLTGDVNTEGRHAWNTVQMDNGKWYYVDVTWDDPKCPEMVEYDYFLIGSETSTPTGTFSKNRTVDHDFGITVSSTAYTFDPYPNGFWMDYFSAGYDTLSKKELKNEYYYWNLHGVQIRIDETARKALVSAMLHNSSEYWHVSVRTYKSSTPVESTDLKDYEIRMYFDDYRITDLNSQGLNGLIKFVPPASSSEPDYVPEYYSLDGISLDKGGSLDLKNLDRFTVGYVERDYISVIVFIIIVAIVISLFVWYRQRSARKVRAAYQAYVPQYSSTGPLQQTAGRSIRYCTQCGASLNDEDSFCRYCGKLIDRSQSFDNNNETNKKE